MYGHVYMLDHGHVVQGQMTQVNREILEHQCLRSHQHVY